MKPRPHNAQCHCDCCARPAWEARWINFINNFKPSPPVVGAKPQ